MPTIVTVRDFGASRQSDPRFSMPELKVFRSTDGTLHVVSRAHAEMALVSDGLSRHVYGWSEDADLHASYVAAWGLDDHTRGGGPGLHAAHIDLIRRWFTTPRVRELRGAFVELARGLVSEIKASDGKFDLADFAGKFSLACASQIVGLEFDEELWRPKINTYVSAPFGEEPRQNDIDEEMWRLVNERIASGDPRGQLVDAVIEAWQTGRLDRKYVVPTLWMVMIAAESTTAANIVSMIGLLLQNNKMDYVRANLDNEGKLALVVEECVRLGRVFESTPQLIAVEDMEVGEFHVEKGTIVQVWYSAANLDIPDGNRFDVTREPNRHIGFSTPRDTHHCLGAQMAKLMMAIALVELVNGLPGLRLDPDGEVKQYVECLNQSYLQAPCLFSTAA